MHPIPQSLLESTFIHSSGVGRGTEQKLWEAGAWSWDYFLAGPGKKWPLSPGRRALLTETVEESIERLEAEDYAWFAELLPASEHWRAIPSFGHRMAFVDIETNGGMAPEDLTVIGVFDGRKMTHFVKGQNLDQFPASLDEAAIIVTFFGTGFDMPFLRRAFPNLAMPQFHVDLCFMLKRLGYRGGLKNIEYQMGIRRSNATIGLSGLDAVRLWQEYRRGRSRSLELLAGLQCRRRS